MSCAPPRGPVAEPEEEEEASSKVKRSSVRPPAKPLAPRRDEPRRRAGKISIVQALDENAGERMRSPGRRQARAREGEARPSAANREPARDPRRHHPREHHGAGSRHPHGRAQHRRHQVADEDGRHGDDQRAARRRHGRADRHRIRPSPEARQRSRHRDRPGGRSRRCRRACCRVRPSSPSWAMSTTARPRCSTRCARPTSRRTRPAASPSISAPIR